MSKEEDNQTARDCSDLKTKRFIEIRFIQSLTGLLVFEMGVSRARLDLRMLGLEEAGGLGCLAGEVHVEGDGEGVSDGKPDTKGDEVAESDIVIADGVDEGGGRDGEERGREDVDDSLEDLPAAVDGADGDHDAGGDHGEAEHGVDHVHHPVVDHGAVGVVGVDHGVVLMEADGAADGDEDEREAKVDAELGEVGAREDPVESASDDQGDADVAVDDVVDELLVGIGGEHDGDVDGGVDGPGDDGSEQLDQVVAGAGPRNEVGDSPSELGHRMKPPQDRDNPHDPQGDRRQEMPDKLETFERVFHCSSSFKEEEERGEREREN